MTRINSTVSFGEQLLSELRDMKLQQEVNNNNLTKEADTGSGASFMDHLKESLGEVNAMQKTSDKMASDLASGKSQNIHETMLAATQSELAFNMIVQVRNKILEAYQEVMRMPI